MKKILCLILILTASSCYAQEEVNVDQSAEKKEIYLDTGFKTKEYKLKKIDYNNPTEKFNNDDTDMPFDFVSSPLQLLKQYQSGDF